MLRGLNVPMWSLWKLGTNLGPTTNEISLKRCTETQNKAKRTDQLESKMLPWTQEVLSSNLGPPTTHFIVFSESRFDLTGAFCTSGSEREFALEGIWYKNPGQVRRRCALAGSIVWISKQTPDSAACRAMPSGVSL